MAAVSLPSLAEDAHTYHYGDHLDVAKVVSIQNPEGCEVGSSTMVYLDSQGVRHTLKYLRTGSQCND
ncbi:DUF2790 domain-containing protein [Pseudomonas azotifigens]|uniref:DUF2790 domain-containing protein n=2 Tax=Stutzerimonas azotifigens TaxID=291995 RepID=A0ABR5Z2X3_9GAMM|nr:DUF2790 domain-containing protein [Stutzerimonas azotifigens]MBA1274518.1 DUF2790 domain-containing protein [Stutzerimonas azotifigens]